MRRTLLLTIAFLSQPVLAAPAPWSALNKRTETMAPDVREQVPKALLGIWKVDQSVSAPRPVPYAIELRTFHYTADAKLQVSFLVITETGYQLLGHWDVYLDGTPGYEYRSDNGSTPIGELRLRKVDERTFALTSAGGGLAESTSTYKLSEDGKTLTVTRNAPEGAGRPVVYRKWDGR